MLSLLFVSSFILTLSYVSSQNINCIDSYECKDSTITTNDNVYCKGYNGCYGASITCDNTAFCTGDYGCLSSTLNCETQVRCMGNYACMYANIENAGEKLQVYGNGGVYGASISNVDAVTCQGYQACVLSTINDASLVQGHGDYGLYLTDIDSNGVTELTVEVLGNNAGEKLDIFCRSGSTCNIDCGAQYGCRNTNLYCYDGSTCNYECDNSCGTSVCPTVTEESNFNSNNDINFDSYIKKIKLKKQNTKKIAIQNLNTMIQQYGKTDGITRHLEWVQQYMKEDYQSQDIIDDNVLSSKDVMVTNVLSSNLLSSLVIVVIGIIIGIIIGIVGSMLFKQKTNKNSYQSLV